ncbi:sugar kinase [Colwellia sp. Bg11-28]|uniref:sugar kinase n=1 Tax=Colwellia sp. Bg11-28 TaxID=2058305 RepID=UPI000C34DD6A|nr:sugar kinase [Colwellia sp. Bg11-28]PKH88550.1 sugar kinase [Colwellia sp. Bg11-28]
MKNVVVMGECMVEFSPDAENTYKQSFAGDVYNTAVYIKRLLKGDTDVSFLTAIGNDFMSESMVNDFRMNDINTHLVKRVSDKQPGAYLIQTSDDGERNFVYWRDTSAAKVTISQLSKHEKIKLIEQCDLFYFSGISIAILDKNELTEFWRLVTDLRNAGIKIAFDSNFRSRLWSNHDEAKRQFSKAFSLSDIVFAGTEDFYLLYQLHSFTELDNFLCDFSIDELIIKNGADGVFYRSTTEQFIFDINPVDNVIDTTSAGDAFNSGFLSAKMSCYNAVEAIAQACRLSEIVIQHRGAIIDEKIFNNFIHSQQN